MPIVRELVSVLGEESSVCHQNLPRPSSGQLSAFEGESSLVRISCGKISGMASDDADTPGMRMQVARIVVF